MSPRCSISSRAGPLAVSKLLAFQTLYRYSRLLHPCTIIVKLVLTSPSMLLLPTRLCLHKKRFNWIIVCFNPLIFIRNRVYDMVIAQHVHIFCYTRGVRSPPVFSHGTESLKRCGGTIYPSSPTSDTHIFFVAC